MKPIVNRPGLFQAGLLLLITSPQQSMAAQPQGALPSAAEIAQQVEYVNRFRTIRNLTYGTGKHRLVVIDRPAGQKPKINTLQRNRNNDYPKGGEVAAKDLAVFRSGKLRGTGILMTDYRDAERGSSYSIWLPSLRKIRRFAEPDPTDSWSGSNFTYGDIYLRRARDEEHELLGTERFPDCLGVMKLTESERDKHTRWLPESNCDIKGRETFKLKSHPKTPNDDYDHRIVWVDRKTFADYRSEFFRNGELVKRIEKDWRSMGLEDPRAQYWVYWYAQTISTGQEGMACIDPSGIAWNSELKPGLWKESTLRRIRR